MLDAALGADDHGHLVNGGGVKGGAQADGLGKLGGSIPRHAVQRLAPPVVGRNVEPGNGSRLVHQLRGLLLQRHSADQVRRALLRGKAGVQISGFGARRLRGVLRPGGPHRTRAGQNRRNNSQSEISHRSPFGRAGPLRCHRRRENPACPPVANLMPQRSLCQATRKCSFLQ